jgi:hypothetical protein
MRRKLKAIWTAQQDAQVREGAAKGWSAMKIDLRLGRSAHAVKKRALQIGVELKSPTRLPRTERFLIR